MLIVGALEYSQQAIVVPLRDWIVLVAMAFGAFDGESKYSRTQNIHLITDDVEPIIDKVYLALAGGIWPHSQESCGNKVIHQLLGDDGLLLIVLQFIPCNLLQKKTIVGLVVIEGADDIVAIAKRHGSQVVRAQLPSLGICVSRHVQPVTSPSLSVTRRVQQAVNQLLVSLRVAIRQESLHFFRLWR